MPNRNSPEQKRNDLVHSAGFAPDWVYYYLSKDYNPILSMLPALAEIPPELALPLAKGILTLRPDVEFPISVNTQEPQRKHNAFPNYIRKMVPKMNGVPVPEPPLFEVLETSETLPRILYNHPGKVDVLINGPASDIADYILAQPDKAKEKIEKIYFMGGVEGDKVDGNLHDFDPARIALKLARVDLKRFDFLRDHSKREWNVFLDPISIEIMLDSGIPMVFIPLNATQHVPLNEAIHTALTTHPRGEAERFLAVYTDKLYRATKLAGQELPLWDAAARLYMNDESIGTKTTKKVNIDANPDSKMFGLLYEDPNGVEVEWCENIDENLFDQALLFSLT